ncbi:heme-binding domain-containing protein [Pedobacter sp. P351]|uniref:heme-binding domain-containing protein n=1 Tax=Pedobacter superstes TaxID=3133441 RepID=UPI0030A2AEB9
MRLRTKVLLILLAVFTLMQFFQPNRNSGKTASANDITKVYPVPDNVQAILKKACYDCHSNSTRYPWYTYIQPFGWMMNSHIKEGKAELNFNEFGSYSARRQRSKIKAIAGSIKDGSMPLDSYTLIHRDAKLNNTEKNLILNWLRRIEEESSQQQ